MNKNKGEAGYRLTLDYPEDYELLKAVYQALYPKNPIFSMRDILEFLNTHPEIKKLTTAFERNISWKAA